MCLKYFLILKYENDFFLNEVKGFFKYKMPPNERNMELGPMTSVMWKTRMKSKLNLLTRNLAEFVKWCFYKNTVFSVSATSLYEDMNA